MTTLFILIFLGGLVFWAIDLRGPVWARGLSLCLYAAGALPALIILVLVAFIQYWKGW
jgi:hypothetical protein